ncbi:MAG: glutathione S-transferase N-terminal domain-containing protein [Rhodospirillales bacterium]|nr:glutathione S-transferase N-terminal domain-containing protein [Rhodospirillales bacterium]MDE2574970.1 glutathione S-transferase N-terminal domain-containing protein [Rhodospirillales bacterium]
MNKLFYSPGACSIGIHVLLEEIGKPYEAVVTNTREGAQFKPEFTSLNPKSKVPTLQRDDGTVLTEFPAIAYWLARTNHERHLLPDDVEGQTRALEAMDYAVATMHMQGFSRMFRPANFAPGEADHDAVKARGREIMEKGLAVMDRALAGKDYVTGSFSIADAALFYVEFWWAARLGLPLPANCAAHFARMKARPAVAAVLRKEGFDA